MPQYSLLIVRRLAVQDPAHRVRRDKGTVSAAEQNGGVEMPYGDAQGEGISAGEARTGVEGAKGVGSQEIVFFG